VYGTAAAIRELNASGTHVLGAKTFGGGSGARFVGAKFDTAAGVAVDATDSVWIVGSVQTGSVPTTLNALEPLPGSVLGDQGTSLGYALKFSSSGDLLYGTYVGNNQASRASRIDSVAVDSQGRPYFILNVNFSHAPPAQLRGYAPVTVPDSAVHDRESGLCRVDFE
jgi:hypothetical protein